MGSIISATFWRMNVPQRVPSWMQLNIWLSATLLFFQRQQQRSDATTFEMALM